MRADRLRLLNAIEQVELISYFGIDLELVWAIVTGHIAALGERLHSVVDSLPD